MWIKVKRDLINLDTVKFVGISHGLDNKTVLYFTVLYFLQGENTTTHIPFDTNEEALSALAAIERLVDVQLRLS